MIIDKSVDPGFTSVLQQQKADLRTFFAQIPVFLYDFAMLLRFSCKNFRSIRDEQTLSLVASKPRTESPDPRLLVTGIKDVLALRCAAIYGPNGSGKSNVLRAMSVFRHMILESQKKWDSSDDIPARDPFLLDDSSKNENTAFEVSVVIDAVEYRYGFSFNATAIDEEWLSEYSPHEKVLFRRKTVGRDVELKFPGRNLKGATLETIRQLTRPNSLFLSAAAQNNYERLSNIHQWFISRFRVISSDERTGIRHFTAGLCKQGAFKDRIIKLMGFADSGIIDIGVEDEEAPETVKRALAAMAKAIHEADPETGEILGIPDDYVRTEVSMTHRGVGGKHYRLSSSEESDGTLAFFSILGPLLDELKDGSILMIDELESSLHPVLARQLIHIFNSPELNPNGGQIVFTTHNTSLLDLGLLLRDQVWFTQKNEAGATDLYPLSDFRPRKDQNIEAAYLAGRFEALPFLDDRLLFESLT